MNNDFITLKNLYRVLPVILYTRAAFAATSDETVDISKAKSFVQSIQDSRPLASDEFTISFENKDLNLRLIEEGYKGFPIVTVSGILDTDLVINHRELRIGAIVIQVGINKCEGLPLATVAQFINDADRPLAIKFRDPSRYFELLDSSAPGAVAKEVTTSYLPANTRDIGLPEQMIVIERQSMPGPTERTRSAQLLDVMEIQYVAELTNGTIVDSSASRCPPGSSSQSIYYVLGQRNGPPVGKGEVPFPPGWDLTLRGMVVGEQRRIFLPTTLAFYMKTLVKVPRYSSVVYTVKLLSLT